MKTLARTVFRRLHLEGAWGDLSHLRWRIPWEVRRRFGRVDRELVARYLGGAGPRKLHIGCGENLLDGWLNADLFPRSPEVLHLDASRPFPFEDGQFDYVFSEHMIEHVSHAEGALMLAECHRVLKNNGTIRISTPDLAFLIELYRENRSELERRYIAWSTETFVPDAPCASATIVINNFVRDWGHLFIYDEASLRQSMARAGFERIRRCRLGESDYEALRNLENVTRMPDGFLALETLTLEGSKAPALSRAPGDS